MFSDESLKEISTIFCGDREDFFSYKSGPKLVSFFNTHFGYNDKYGPGFPSRWLYVYNKLVELINKNLINSFFSLILSKRYIMSDGQHTEAESILISEKAFLKIKNILSINLLTLIKKDEKYFIMKTEEDLEQIGSGGFANAYYQKSTGLVVKKLKEDFWNDEGICSRFKREFEITSSLHDLANVVKVTDYSSENHSYKMEKAETTLEKYVLDNQLNDDTKINCIRQILHVMKIVHERSIIHRDISPNNIFIIHGLIKIADFGLGKDLKIFSSHQTNVTNSFGQYFYCAPEQFMMLKEADKRSDIFSLGRLINFIMTADCQNYAHMFKSVTEKATSENTASRYADTAQLLSAIEKSIEYHQNKLNISNIHAAINNRDLNVHVIMHVSGLASEDICKLLQLLEENCIAILLKYMQLDPRNADEIIQSIATAFGTCCIRFEDYDIFANFASQVLEIESFKFPVYEQAANILRYIAVDINRYYAIDLVKKITSNGVDPMIKDILT